MYLSYSGPVQYDTIGNLIGELKEAMFEAKIKQVIYKKVLMVMIESLENVFKYHEYFEKDRVVEEYPPSILITSVDKVFFVECTNPIRKKDIPKLKAKLDHVNSLSKAEVKDEYKVTITNGQFSEKGGAGLGIIEMAKITDDKLAYSFCPVNSEFEHFRLKLRIKCG